MQVRNDPAAARHAIGSFRSSSQDDCCREQPSAPLGSFLWSESVGFRFSGSKGNISGAQRTSIGVRFQFHADELATILLFRLQLLADAPHFDERQRCSYRNQTAEDNEHNEVHLRRPLFLNNMTLARSGEILPESVT